jgi:thiol peroxidase
MERTGVITFKGGPLTLVGPEIRAGDAAPDFTASGQDLSPVSLSDLKGQTVVLSVVPSLDTPVCEIQTKRFNEEAAKLRGTKLLTISMDLPFAQKRFCGAHGIDNIQVVSDYKDRSFAQAWGLYIKELGLLARAVYVVGKDGKVAYAQVVKEVTQEPDYAPALEAARKA